MDVAVIGAGRVGTALAVRLLDAGHRIVAVSGRGGTVDRAARYLPGVPIRPPPIAARGTEVVIIGTPDDLIEPTASSLADESALGEGQTAIHLSGATSLGALSAPRDAGAEVLSVHPLQTFPDVDAALARIPGSGIAVTALSEVGYELGERLANDVGGRSFRLADEAKPIYHAAAVFASNYLVAITALADELFRDAGMPEPAELFLPLQRATLERSPRTSRPWRSTRRRRSPPTSRSPTWHWTSRTDPGASRPWRKRQWKGCWTHGGDPRHRHGPKGLQRSPFGRSNRRIRSDDGGVPRRPHIAHEACARRTGPCGRVDLRQPAPVRAGRGPLSVPTRRGPRPVDRRGARAGRGVGPERRGDVSDRTARGDRGSRSPGRPP